jgi:hypothetical protein
MTRSTPPGAAMSGENLPSFNPRVPSPARMWNYWLGGKDNFAADREAAERVLEVLPSVPAIARIARQFLTDAVYQLAAGHGIRQFLDIGTGPPTTPTTLPSGPRPRRGSSTWTTTRWCSGTPRRC